jgi:mannose-6-phosphate isomerase
VPSDLDSRNFDGLDRFAFDPRRIEKPWGWELIWAEAEDYVGKLLFVRAGHSLSLQFHRVKDESWYVHEGRAEVEVGEPGQAILSAEVLGPGAALRFRPGTMHRIKALEDTLVLEASTPHLDDLVRLDDRYGRIEG